MKTRFFALGLVSLLLPTLAYAADAGPRRLSREMLLDKIRGAWAGQMIGVAYGARTEFRSRGAILEGEIKPEPLSNAINQDDLYVEMTFAKVMDDSGLNASAADYGRAFRDSKYSLWHANASARRNLNRGLQPPWTGHPRYNLHANDIDFQIEADFIGIMCPGLPRAANRFCDRVGQVMNYGDGVYGGMFVCGMYAVAFFETDPRKVVEAGLACIPARSQYGLLLRDLLDWSAEHPGDWRKVWQLLQAKWDKDDPCPEGALTPFNIDAKLNGAYIALGLLYGGGDFDRTMEIATRCGQDSDCNPSSAAGVLGAMIGYSRLPQKYRADLAGLAETKFQFTDYSFNDIVRSTETRALKVIERAGGKVTASEVLVPPQTPKPPRLEQWDPGVPESIIAWDDPAWQWQGAWTAVKNARVANGAGAEVTLRFSGSGIALVGRLTQEGGRADVFLDGRRRKPVADAYIVERTTDQDLWHTDNLKPGTHTLRLVMRDDADPRSKGRRLVLEKAIVFRPR
jgi:hypothetical protein